MRQCMLALTLFWLSSEALAAEQAKPLGEVKFHGDLGKDSEAVSAIGVAGRFVILGGDEKRHVYVFKPSGPDYELARSIKLSDGDGEMDIEGIACDGTTVYVTGSHCKTRKKVKADASYEENRKQIATVEDRPSREVLVRFELDSEGDASNVSKSSLKTVIGNTAIGNTVLLKPFTHSASKENGVDIEGLAIRDGSVYAGFRGPVLAQNYVPVLKCKFAEQITSADVLFVDLEGRGIRDLTRSRDGLLVLAGPIGDGPGSYQLYAWDGQDCLPGARDAGSTGKCRLLCEIPDHGGKAEGIAVLKETDSAFEILIVYDGLENGGARRFQVTKRD